MWKKAWKVLFVGLCGVGALWFCLPLLHGGFGIGSVFGIAICGMGIWLVWAWPRWKAQGGWRKGAVWALTALYVLGLGWAGFLTGLMISYQTAAPPEGLNVVVLGAQVYSAERMGKSLSNRIDAAYAYLRDNPEAKCIVTGGQGGDEPCPESLTQKNALTRMGIDPARIYMEDKSGNTRQNLNYAMEVAQEQGLDTKVVVVSQSFHLYRAVRLAESAGFEAYGLTAETDPVIYPQYYGRELISLTKWHVERLLLGK